MTYRSLRYPDDWPLRGGDELSADDGKAWHACGPGNGWPALGVIYRRPIDATSGPVTEAPYCPIHQSYKPCEHNGGVRQEDGSWRWPSEVPDPVADREAFEAWIEDQFDHPPQDREEPLTKDGAYHAYLWRTWQAALAYARGGK